MYFCVHLNKPGWPIYEAKILLNCRNANEASQAYYDAHKRIHKVVVFMKVVYNSYVKYFLILIKA